MSRIVYSSGSGDQRDSAGCRRCGKRPCRCEPATSLAPDAHALVVRSEVSGRRGKTVTLAGPFYLVRADATKLHRSLKASCGSGGTLKVGLDRRDEPCFTFEIQGEKIEQLIELLSRAGYPAKRSGG
jgi:translation initiation factor 1